MTKTNLVAVITNNNINYQLALLKKYKSLINAIEIRVDTFYKENKIEETFKIIKKIKEHFPDSKIIITFRKFDEGGYKKVTEKTRGFIISNIVTKCHRYIDFIDIEYFSKIKNQIINLAKNYKKTVILSFHELTKTPKTKKILKIAKQMQKFIKTKKCKYLIKIVFKNDLFANYLKVLKAIYLTEKRNFKKISIFTTGKTSLISRTICMILDMPIVYGATARPVVASQPSVFKLARIKEFIN
jgi:3-dehydroquinate dehydratase type I